MPQFRSFAAGSIGMFPQRLVTRLALAAAVGASALGCSSPESTAGAGRSPAGGDTSTPASSAPTSPTTPASPSTVVQLGATRIARLSRAEYVASVKALLGVDLSAEVQALPIDAFAPFDNNAEYQSPSGALIQGLSVLAELAAEKALATPEQRSAFLGCMPAGPSDDVCFRQFITTFGRRALHRPLSESEINGFAQFLSFAGQEGDFFVAVRMALRALLQDLEFVYRVEIGTPLANDPHTVQLNDWELGARLSYLLWGQTPDDALLAKVESGELSTPEAVKAEVARLLSDPRGLERIARFHALWLGYEELPHAPALSQAMRAETDALIRRVVFETDSAWPELFNSSETYIDAQLSGLYGMAAPAPSGFAWAPYTDPLRRGILSHASLLSNGAKNGDSSPTLRGKFILERLLCSPVPPPPPGVNADAPPPPAAGPDCKADRYQAHSTNADCVACHRTMDPIGFGLESFDSAGRFRTHDEGKPECAITGQGELPTAGAFRGPAELGQLLIASEKLAPCLVKHVYEFALQKHVGAADQAPVAALEEHFQQSQLSLRDALTAWLGSGTFRYRRIEPFTASVSTMEVSQ